MTARIPCIVPGCRRTHKPANFTEWICPKHWPMVPKATRRVYIRAKRKKRDPAALYRLWCRCKRIAMEENFMGLGS